MHKKIRVIFDSGDVSNNGILEVIPFLRRVELL